MPRFVIALFSLAFLGLIGAGGLAAFGLSYFGRDLPDYKTLANYQPPIVTRAYASDGRLLAEFATEKRVFVPIASIPPQVINAFLSAEDKNFYTHRGVDPVGIARALLSNLRHAGSDKRAKGASTITQQVARNFLLTDLMAEEKGDKAAKYRRKIKEAILSFRIEQTYSKDKILELYLNEIFLGSHAYGVAAAALEYFDKPLDQLAPEEAALLAALPKAPSNYNPERRYDAALQRRNWVLSEMADNGFLSKEEARAAKARPIVLKKRTEDEYVDYPYFAEGVRRWLQGVYGDKGLYEGGMIVKTTLVPAYQKVAEKVLRDGLVAYDMRYGLRGGPVATLDLRGDWRGALGRVERPAGAGDFELAVVLETGEKKAAIGFEGGKKGVIPFDKMSWARKPGGPAPKRVDDVLKPGDVWLVARAEDKPAETSKKEKEPGGDPVYWLRQIPQVSGGLIAMDPHTGRVFAMTGGFSYEISEFDRVTQAQRQPGSAFKPFVYLSALEAGFTPATLVLDEPIVIDQGPGLAKWKPKNYHQEFNGPTPLRIGLEKSLNLMTVRLASYVGMEKIVETVKRFGVMDDMPPYLAYALGAGETTLWRMAAGYSIFVNGGKKVVPTLIDRVQDRDGKTVYVHDQSLCDGCGPLTPWEQQTVPNVPDARPQVADARNMYQLVSMMEGVVQKGTAASVGFSKLGFPVAGKTGTTNDSKDAWFIGFTPDLVVGVYVGYDEPKSLGPKETGGRVAAPIVKAFMEKALTDAAPLPFRVPPGIRLVEVNRKTGTRSSGGDTILEAFLAGAEPGDEPVMFTGKGVGTVRDVTSVGEGADTGLGGLY